MDFFALLFLYFLFVQIFGDNMKEVIGKHLGLFCIEHSCCATIFAKYMDNI